MTPEEIRGALGADTAVSDAYGLATADVPADGWIAALTAARDTLGLTYFDWLTAVDESDAFTIAVHVCAAPGPRLLLRTRVPHDTPVLPTATGVYAGAGWHERETAEMFGITFEGHPNPAPLLLPDGFEGHPLRKDFVLASRVAKPWPGAKEPGESDHAPAGARSPGRRRILPPGVPDASEWGPQAAPRPAAPEPSAQPDTPSRPERPRRTRSAGEGSATQRGSGEEPPTATAPPAAPRRARRASEGSASQSGATEQAAQPPTPDAPPSAGPRRGRRASDGSASQQDTPATPAPGTPAEPGAPDAPATTDPARPPTPPTPTGVPAAEPTPPTPPTPPGGPRRSRRASDGSATQRGPQPPAEPEPLAEPESPGGPEEDT
ncbi:NADH-quinone oxidoreductase subunit C [Uniformispora flossi]|uniref:NADH-quinone oxidoreductase subunit C n=1 Tax=Uniformispora flossi TaxID=3390723 RepID=UPI003C2C2714